MLVCCRTRVCNDTLLLIIKLPDLKLVQVRWFSEVFSKQFSSNLYTLLGANSQAAAEEAKAQLDQGLRVGDMHSLE